MPAGLTNQQLAAGRSTESAPQRPLTRSRVTHGHCRCRRIAVAGLSSGIVRQGRYPGQPERDSQTNSSPIHSHLSSAGQYQPETPTPPRPTSSHHERIDERAHGAGGASRRMPSAAERRYVAPLLGHPLIATDRLPTLGTVGDLLLADLSQYVIALRQDIAPASDISLGIRVRELLFKATARVDGQPLPRTPITPRVGSATLSQFVSRAARLQKSNGRGLSLPLAPRRRRVSRVFNELWQQLHAVRSEFHAGAASALVARRPRRAGPVAPLPALRGGSISRRTQRIFCARRVGAMRARPGSSRSRCTLRLSPAAELSTFSRPRA